MVFVQIQRTFGKPFAFRILNRCNQNLAVGRNLETCKIKLRTHFNTALNSSSKKTSQNSSKWLLGLSGICGCVTIAIKHCPVAHCKTNVIKSRLDHLDNEDVKSDAKFDWSGFFKLLVPELGYLIAAIISALAAAFINIKIPIRRGSKYFRFEIKKPALKLVKYYCIQGLLTFCYISLLTTVGENVATSLRKQLFDAYLRQDIEFFDRNKTGELVDRLTSDIQDFKSSFKLCISSGLRATAQTIGCVGIMYTISPKLTGLMITVVPAIIGTGTLMGSGLRKLSKKAQSQLSKSTAVADEAIGNVRTVRAFAMESKENEMFGQEVESSRKLNIKLGLGIGAFQCLANIALNGIVLGTMFAGGRLMTRDEISAGDLMSFLVSTQTIERSLAQLSLLFGNVVRGLSAGARSRTGSIERFLLTISAGKVVALVGLSGGGKSTVAALLERFYEIGQGKITLDGEDIKDLDPSWLRGRAIGFINHMFIYNHSLKSFEAADLANAHSFITGFPEGYKTVLGERGVTAVSGGQKQRIAIARALIKIHQY
ncbi:ABCB8 [Mytilus edulis]|uniref:ABCB8 n=1 Tax=Mytilus edulis TaxID=6550 RepID=A0A8S3TLP8_MYTED|nr:ABCB8 [Mytilus edulis]